MTTRIARLHLAALAAIVALAACENTAGGRATDSTGTSSDSAAGTVTASTGARDTTWGPTNTMGRIPVLEYHVIADKETQYTITREHLKKDLQLVYDRGYRPITIQQMLDKDFSSVPDGMSPVVFVFDDASDSQFRYVERGGKLEVDPTSGLGIWEEFARAHPDWKGKAVFCMLNGGAAGHNFFGDGPAFGGQKKAWRLQKVRYLAEQGHELCAHTLWHMQLSKFPDDKVQENIARNVMGIDSAVVGYKVRTMALPQGLWPKNRPLAWKGSWKDPKSGRVTSYDFDAVLEVSGGPTRSPYDPAFNGHSINRIEAFGTQVPMVLDKLEKSKARFIK